VATDLETELDRLYQAPASSFVTERNKLVQELRRSGERTKAEEVSRLGRPSPVAWVINQLHFKAAKELAALHKTGAALRRAQEHPDQDDFAARNREHQKALHDATDRALALADDAGLSQTANLKRRVELTLNLLSAATDEVDPPPGRMTAELEPVGFDAFTSVASPPARAAKKREKNSEDPEHEEKIEAVRAALGAADKEVRRLEKEAERGDARYQRAVREVEDAERRVEDVRRARDEARKFADDANERLETARRELEGARRTLEDLPK
jgi:hypothetical protein